MSDQQQATSGFRYAAKVARITARDLRWGAKSVLLNTVGGSPLMPRAGRIALLRAFGAEVGSTGLFPGWTLEGDTHNLHIGTGCFFNTRTFIESVAEVRIGNDVAFGMEVMILTSHHDIGPDGRWAAETTPRPVVIGDHVWVGARATILPGVTIGEGTIIAAGAVVAKDCEPWSVYGGVPAKRIKGLRDGGDS